MTDDVISLIDRAAAALKARQSAGVGYALSQDTRQPDQVAEQERIGRAVGLPGVAVQADPDGFRREAEARRAAELLRDAPATTAWLEDMQNGGMARDDLEHLTWFEKNLGPLGRAVGRGVRTMGGDRGLRGAMSTAATLVDAGRSVEQLYAEELTRMGPAPYAPLQEALARESAQARFDMARDMTPDRLPNIIREGADALALARDRMAKVATPRSQAAQRALDALDKAETLGDALGALAADPAGTAALSVELLAESLPALAVAAATTAVTRSPAAGVAVMGGASFLQENTAEAMSFLAEQDADLSTPDSAALVLLNGPLMEEARRRGLAKGVVVAAFDAVSGGIAGKALSQSPVGDVLVQGVVQGIMGGAGEAFGSLASSGAVRWGEVLLEGIAGAVTAPVEIAGVAGRKFWKDAQRAAKTGKTAELLAQVDDVAAKSKLKARDPERLAALIDTQTDAALHVPAAELITYFQAKDVSAEEIAVSFGLDLDVLRDAAETGGTVTVPASIYATKISGTDDAAWFADNGTFDPDEMTAAEARAFNDQVRDMLDEAMAAESEARASAEVARSGEEQVRAMLRSQLRAAGRSTDVADAEARLMAAFLKVMGQRSGRGDALDAFRAAPVDIVGPGQTQSRRRGELDAMIETARRQKKAPKPTGKSLMDWVKARGGLRDEGGDFEAMGLPPALIAESRADVLARKAQPTFGGMPSQAKGEALDMMARAAAVDGYLPGVDDADLDRAFMDALSEEMRGRPTFRPGEGGMDRRPAELEAELDRRGLSLDATNDEIAAALAGDGQTYNQDYTLKTDTPAFRAWFGDSKVVDADGDPLVVYHATNADFSTFSFKKGGSTTRAAGGDIGSIPMSKIGFWASENDVSAHLGASTVMPLYLAIENPKVIRLADLFDLANEAKSAAKLKQMFTEDGYDGLKVDDSEFGGWSYVAFSPTQIKSVFNRGTFDPNDPRMLYQSSRGSITFPIGGPESGTTLIRLMESANLSTFVHEAGHYFLEAMASFAATGTDDLRADLDTVRRYLGNDGSAFTRDQHETWARTVEAYVMEGKAPSLELLDVFSRMKAWLVRIYRGIAGLNLKMTPEIRDVMDRLLATDAEIAAARDAAGMSPLFAKAPADMTDASWQVYQRMARRSSEEAEAALLTKTMAKVRRQREAWWKAERAKVREDVASTVYSKPEHRLIEAIANGRWLGGNREVPDMRIDRAALVDMFGEGILPELSRQRLGGKRAIYADNGTPPEIVADLFGFATVTQMVETLQNTGKLEAAISAEADRVMSDRYGDPLNDGSIEAEAMEAAHSDQRAGLLAMEARIMSKRAGRPTSNMTARVYRARARAMLGRMPVGDAIRADSFMQAGRQAGKRAEQMFAKVATGRDAKTALTAAAKHKEAQLLNHYLYMEARDLARMVESKRKAMRDYGKASVRKNIGVGYIEQIDALLEDYDFRVRGPKAIRRAESLKAFVDRMTAEGRAYELAIDARLIEAAQRKHFTRMSVDELRGLFDTIANIDHLGRLKRDLLDAQGKRNLDALVADVVGGIDANLTGIAPGRVETTGERVREEARAYLNTTLTADTLLREVDGFKDMGKAWTAVKAPIDAGFSRLIERRRKAAEDMDRIYSVYTPVEMRDMAVRRANKAAGEPMSKWQLLALALNTGNEQNYQRVTNPDAPQAMQPGAVEAALAALTEKDWRFVQSVWDYLETYWPEIKAKEERLTGLAPEKVQHRLMVKAPGFVTGGYYPIRYDDRISGLTSDFKSNDLADEMRSGIFAKAQTAKGHTETRVATTKQAVKLDLAVLHQHVDQVLYDLELGEAVNGSWKVLHDPRVRAAYQSKGRRVDYDTLEVWLLDVAAGERSAGRGMQRVLRHLRTGFTISRLAFNIATALIQPTGLFQSSVVIGKRAVATGTIKYMANPARWAKLALDASPMMRERQRTFERDMFNALGEMEAGPVTGRAARFHRNVVMPLSFALMQKVQFWAVDMPTWVSAYEKKVAETKDNAAALTYADAMLKRSQGSGILADRGALERGTTSRNARQQELPKMLTALGSYMFAKFNIAYERTRRTDFRSPVQVMSLAADYVLLFTLEAVLLAAIRGGLPGEDDEPEDWAKFLASETALGMMATVPLVREASSVFKGFDAGGAMGGSIEMLAKPLVEAGQGDFDKAAVKAAMDAAGIIFKLPAAQVNSIIESLFEPDMSLRSDPDPMRAIGIRSDQRTLADLMFGD